MFKFRYTKKALDNIQELRITNSSNSKKLQEVFDKLKNGENIGERKKGDLKETFCVPLGRAPEFRLFYNKYDCCVIYCSDAKNCEGLIDIIYFATREQTDRMYKNNGTLSNKINRFLNEETK